MSERIDGKNPEEEKKKKKNEINTLPLTLIPNKRDEVAEEMQKIFDEDKVVHRHGSSEPESD